MAKKKKDVAEGEVDFMEKKGKKQKSDRDLGENICGVQAERLRETETDCGAIDAKLAKLRGEKGGVLKTFEEHGGNKKALAEAQRIMNMEIGTARHYVQATKAYLIEFGFYNQLDMFEKQNGMDLTTVSGEEAANGPDDDSEEDNGAAEPQALNTAADAFVAAHSASAH